MHLRGGQGAGCAQVFDGRVGEAHRPGAVQNQLGRGVGPGEMGGAREIGGRWSEIIPTGEAGLEIGVLVPIGQKLRPSVEHAGAHQTGSLIEGQAAERKDGVRVAGEQGFGLEAGGRAAGVVGKAGEDRRVVGGEVQGAQLGFGKRIAGRHQQGALEGHLLGIGAQQGGRKRGGGSRGGAQQKRREHQ
ncbi:Uncharacterised protein [uncultured archaeon]|nr:Uncharacterised protein [uncultured archaeon]